MATPAPVRSDLFPVAALLPTAFKVQLAQFYDFAVALLGSDGVPKTARDALGVPMPNWLHNPDGAVYQRTVAATADDAYMDDRWYALTQTASITPSRLSNPEDGYRYGLRMTQSQVTAQRMGRAQIIEGLDAVQLRGKTVTYGGRVQASTGMTLRCALLAWTGTEDAVTSDVVNNWASGTFTPGNFFNATSLSLVATGSVVLTAATPANLSCSGVVPSGANNLIALYWTDAAAAQNVTVDAWGQRVVEAATLVEAIKRAFAAEVVLCQRRYEIVGFACQQTNMASGAAAISSHGYAVAKAPAPALTTAITVLTNTNFSAVTVRTADTRFMQIQGTNATASTANFYEGTVAVGCDL